LAGVVACQLAGCANLWDDVTARGFKVRNLYTRDDPMTVLNTNTDGDERVKALRALKEPRANGGGEAEQDRVMEILTRAAVTEPQPNVRIAAIETLGKFQDPRAVPALTSAYEATNQLAGDAAANVRCLALTSLGQTRRPEAIRYLVRVAQTETPPEAPERDRQQVRDCRLAAVRALSHFEYSREVGEAMARLLQTEKDVALRDRATETYVAVTGAQPPAAPIALPSPEAPTPGDDGVRLTGGTDPNH
jgi:HEAT repeat protein